MVCTGDYDYDDRHNLPAGCHFQAAPLQESALAGTSVNGHAGAPAPTPSSVVIAEAAPLQTIAPPMPHDVAGDTDSTSYLAPAPAPEGAFWNGTLVTATQAAVLSAATDGDLAQGKIFCKPIAARGEPARPLSTAEIAGIAVAAVVAMLILICCVCRPRCEYMYESNGITTKQAWDFKWGMSQKKSVPSLDTNVKG